MVCELVRQNGFQLTRRKRGQGPTGDRNRVTARRHGADGRDIFDPQGVLRGIDAGRTGHRAPGRVELLRLLTRWLTQTIDDSRHERIDRSEEHQAAREQPDADSDPRPRVTDERADGELNDDQAPDEPW